MNRISKARASRRIKVWHALTEGLEGRRLLCTTDGPELLADLTAASSRGTADHSAAWYKPVATSDASGDANATYNVNAAGLPLLTSRADGQGFKIFLDFDGFGANLPFSTDADTTTFNASEQANIYDTWRDIVSFYSPFNVNVTTVQPPVGGSNPAFAWQLTSNSISGGYAYVGWVTNDAPHGFTGSDNAVNRHSGLAHEIGHLMGLSHQSEYDKFGNKTDEYTDGYDIRDRAVIGIDYAENVRGWFYGRNSDAVTTIQDDMATISGTVKAFVGGDGYRPDDVGDTLATATAVPATGGVIPAYLERLTDADVFKFTSNAPGTWEIAATPTYESATAPKIELLDTSGNIIAARDDADQRNGVNNDQEFSLDLPAGTFYVRVTSSGDYGELGEYTMTASPLMSGGYTTTDVGQPYRAGTASYNPTTNTLTQLGGGNDIWSTSDQFRFTSAMLNGDATITARIDSLDNTDFNAKAGVMIRQSLASYSSVAYMGIKPSGVLDPIERQTANGVAFQAGDVTNKSGPWVRLVRAGNVFSFYNSADGQSWNLLSSSTIAMTGPVLIGFATNSRATRKAAWATFSNIAVAGSIGNAAVTYNALAAPTSLTAVPAAGANTSIVLNWADAAGETGYAIDRSVDGVTYTQIATVGANVTTFTDSNPFGSMRYFYRIASQSAATRSTPSAAATVVNKPGTPPTAIAGYDLPYISFSPSQVLLNWADVQGDAGYRVERSSDGGATYTQIATTAQNDNAYNVSGLAAGTAYLFRITPITTIGDGITGSLLISTSTRLAALNNLRFTARATNSMSIAWDDAATETGYRVEKSIDGDTWSTAATLGQNVTTWSDTSVTAAGEYYYRVYATNALTQSTDAVIFAASPSASTLPAGWTDQDVGVVPGAGTASVTGTNWSLLGSGADIWGNSDQFHYASHATTGDGSITARILNVEQTDTYSKGGVMYRESAAANSAYAFVALSPGVGLQFECRTSTGASSINLGIINTTARFVRLTRAGNVFTAAYSSDAATWTTIGSQTIVMSASATQGLAVTSHNTTHLALGTFDSVAITGGTVANTAPTIVTANVGSPSTVTDTTSTLSATFNDDGGAQNLTYIWSIYSKPFDAPAPTFSVNNALGVSSTVATFHAAGTYAISVTARDVQGLTATSTCVITVKSTITTLTIAPVPNVAPGATQQFTAAAINQFQATITPDATWTASTGTITSTGLWTAPAIAGPAIITATAGGKTAQLSIGVQLSALEESFDFNAAQQQLRFKFNGNLGASLASGDVTVMNLANNVVTPGSAIVSAFDSGTNEATFRFDLSGGVLPDGNYRATIPAGSVDVGGVPLTSDATFTFYVLAGDMDRDRDVDFVDLLTLSQNYGQIGRTFSQGNLNYSADGAVDFSDLLILAQRYGTNLAALNAAPLKAVAAPTQATKRKGVVADVIV